MALITMRQAITDALREEMQRDDKVFIMGQEVGVWGGTYAVTRGFYDLSLIHISEPTRPY